MDPSWGPLPLVVFVRRAGGTATSMVGCFRSWEKKTPAPKKYDLVQVAFLGGGPHFFGWHMVFPVIPGFSRVSENVVYGWLAGCRLGCLCTTSPIKHQPSLPGVVGWSPARNNKRWRFSRPTGSIGLIYLPTWMVDFYGKCRSIYHMGDVFYAQNVRFPLVSVSVPKLWTRENFTWFDPFVLSRWRFQPIWKIL